MSVLIMCVGLAAAIGVHEAAHLLTARAFGVAVTDAYWGFGPKAWSKRIGETTYGVRWLPLGGYVKLGGHHNTAWGDGTPIPDERLMEKAAWWKQTLVVFAGVVANILLALVIIWGLLFVFGKWEPTPTVDRIVENSAAHQAGIEPGDRLLRVAGQPISQWSHLGAAVAHRGGETVTVTVERTGSLKVFTDVQLGWLGESGFLGVGPTVINKPVGIVESGIMSVGATGRGLVASARSLLRVFNPQYMWQLVNGPDGGGDPTRPVSLVGAVQISTGVSTADAWLLVAGLNMSVAVLNMLPVPPFDGGHATGMLFRRVRYRKLRERITVATATVVVAWMLFVVVALVVLDVTAPAGA